MKTKINLIRKNEIIHSYEYLWPNILNVTGPQETEYNIDLDSTECKFNFISNRENVLHYTTYSVSGKSTTQVIRQLYIKEDVVDYKCPEPTEKTYTINYKNVNYEDASFLDAPFTHTLSPSNQTISSANINKLESKITRKLVEDLNLEEIQNILQRIQQMPLEFVDESMKKEWTDKILYEVQAWRQDTDNKLNLPP